jgi:hypothetical protein
LLFILLFSSIIQLRKKAVTAEGADRSQAQAPFKKDSPSSNKTNNELLIVPFGEGLPAEALA